MNFSQNLLQTVKNGVQLFNHGAFYEAHEFFEDAWRQTQEESREFYRALLHLSGGFFRLQQDRPSAARKFFTKAQYWLAYFPNNHLGFDLLVIKQDLKTLIKSYFDIIVTKYNKVF